MSSWDTGVRRYLLRRKYRLSRPIPGKSGGAQPEGTRLQADLQATEQCLRATFAGCDDITLRPQRDWGLLLYCSSLTDGSKLFEQILSPLVGVSGGEPSPELIRSRLTAQGEVQDTLERLVAEVLSGKTAVLIAGEPRAFLLEGKGPELRSISEPQTEVAIRGPRDGFVEDRITNISLVRRRLRHPGLKVQTMHLGRLSQTAVSLLWMEGVANASILDEVRRRLQPIDLDVVLESAFILEFISDHPYSLVPVIRQTERPDRAAAWLSEGRVVIIVDNTPLVMAIPAIFTDFINTSEDYAVNYIQTNLVRLIRAVGIFVTIVLPGTYVAVTAFHQELLPTPLLLNMAAAREGVPVPAVIEALAMQLVFEVIREAGIRMPTQIGNAVTIVGALVIGESAVRAGLISAPMVIVVALTALSSFVVPDYSFMLVWRVVSLLIILMAGLFGLLGILVGLIAVLIHLAGLRSFGVSYLKPIVPANLSTWSDALYRLPLFRLRKRPGWAQDQVRMAPDQKPAPEGVDPPVWQGRQEE